MAFNPYVILRVPQHATVDELAAAYERELATAARLGAHKTAQEVDQAYSLLRDPRRRSLYDRHQVTDQVDRLHPLQRYAPPRAVPFRTWSPAETNTPARTPCPPRASTTRTVVVLGLISLLVSAGGYVAHTLRSPAATTTWVRGTCPATVSAAAYSFTAPQGAAVRCSDGSAPIMARPTP